MLPLPVFTPNPPPGAEVPQLPLDPQTLVAPQTHDTTDDPDEHFRLHPAKSVHPNWRSGLDSELIKTIEEMMTDIITAPSFRRQIELLMAADISQRQMTRMFACSISSVQYQLKQLSGPILGIGRPSQITDETIHLSR